MDTARSRPPAGSASLPSVPDSSRPVAGDSASRDTSRVAKAVPDTSKDTAKVRKPAAKDTVAAKKTLPPRLLSFDDQLLFALVFMSYIALMLTSLTNLNP